MASRGGSRYFKAVAARRYPDTGNDMQRGMQAGQQVGKLLGSLGSAIQGARKDAAANALMNQQAAASGQFTDPGADLSTDLPEDVSPAIGGIATTPEQTPFTGGVEGMKLQQQFESDQLDTALKKAKLADYIASTQGTGSYAKRATPVEKGVTVSGATSPWSGAGSGALFDSTTAKGGRVQKYVPGSSDVENDPSSDDPTKVRADYEAYHPGSDFGDFSRVSPDPKTGDYVIKDKNGQPVETVPKAEGDIYRMRMDAAKRKAGLPYTPSIPGQGSDSSSTLAAGTQGNPIVPQGQLHLRSLPAGAWVVDPKTGQKYQIQKQPLP